MSLILRSLSKIACRERHLPKLNVAGSIPVSRSNLFSKLAIRPRSCAPFVLRSHDSQTAFQPAHGDLPTLNRRSRIGHAYSEAPSFVSVLAEIACRTMPKQ
jgi:hypothetical protein